jgi:kynurenine formamidase
MAMNSIAQCVVIGKRCNAVDLSYPLDEASIFWPGGEGFKLCMNCCTSAEFGYKYAAGVITCAEHGGTHVDAPFHFKADGTTVDQIPLAALIGPCKVINIVEQCLQNDNYTLSPNDIISFEAQHGALDTDDIVLIHTGWHTKYHLGPAEYLGFDEGTQGPYSSDSVLTFPAVGKEAAQLFVERKVTAVGLDTGNNVIILTQLAMIACQILC